MESDASVPGVVLANRAQHSARSTAELSAWCPPPWGGAQHGALSTLVSPGWSQALVLQDARRPARTPLAFGQTLPVPPRAPELCVGGRSHCCTLYMRHLRQQVYQ